MLIISNFGKFYTSFCDKINHGEIINLIDDGFTNSDDEKVAEKLLKLYH